MKFRIVSALVIVAVLALGVYAQADRAKAVKDAQKRVDEAWQHLLYRRRLRFWQSPWQGHRAERDGQHSVRPPRWRSP